MILFTVIRHNFSHKVQSACCSNTRPIFWVDKFVVIEAALMLQWICMSALPIKLSSPGFSHRLDVQSAAASLKSYRCIIWDSGCGSNELMTYWIPPCSFIWSHLSPPPHLRPPLLLLALCTAVHMCSNTAVCSTVTSFNPQRNAILQLLHTLLWDYKNHGRRSGVEEVLTSFT